jgi:hypothetical protein
MNIGHGGVEPGFSGSPRCKFLKNQRLTEMLCSQRSAGSLAKGDREQSRSPFFSGPCLATTDLAGERALDETHDLK